ncbi:MAG: class I SAM-dependent methyltransferase [Planctomycetota bacterium]|nr:class I SAM-dependent methyltransferase [Planctomycetota bacterium]
MVLDWAFAVNIGPSEKAGEKDLVLVTFISEGQNRASGVFREERVEATGEDVTTMGGQGIYTTQKEYFRDAYRSGVHGWPTEGPTGAILQFLKKMRREGIEGRFLDIGCGEGRHLIPFARAGFRCEGFDLEPLALERAEGYLRKAGVRRRVNLRKGDALRLPYPESSFDVILDSGCFHHIRISDERRFVRGILKVLKPGGTFLLTVFDVNFRHTPDELVHKRRRWLVHRGHYDRFFTAADIRRVFGKEFVVRELVKEAKGLSHFWHVRMRSRVAGGSG